MKKIPGGKTTAEPTPLPRTAPLWKPEPKKDEVLEAIAKYQPILQGILENWLTVTERDKFAQAALKLVWAEAPSVEEAAEQAYAIADAMLAVRSGKAVKRG